MSSCLISILLSWEYWTVDKEDTGSQAADTNIIDSQIGWGVWKLGHIFPPSTKLEIITKIPNAYIYMHIYIYGCIYI